MSSPAQQSKAMANNRSLLLQQLNIAKRQPLLNLLSKILYEISKIGRAKGREKLLHIINILDQIRFELPPALEHPQDTVQTLPIPF